MCLTPTSRLTLIIGMLWLSSAIAYAQKPARASEPQAQGRPSGLVPGGAFIDLILPIPVDGGLVWDTWGGENVKPRVVANGIEDPKWSYWCNRQLVGPDGKEHLFAVRWPQNKGHKDWVRSVLVHAVADKPTGPFKVVEEIGPGHNADAYVAKDGTYVISVTGRDYRSKDINGPWTMIRPQFDVTEHSMSNKTFAQREDGSYLMVTRSGTVWISEDGLGLWRRITPTSVYPYAGALEDPVIWRDEVQYNMIVNDWPKRTAHYGRSPDGLHWTWEPGTAYDNNVVRHPDGSIEHWFKIERPKVRQDAYGRATHLNLAAIDCPKDQADGSNSHSSKAVIVPLIVARRLAILNSTPISSETKEIQVQIKAEDGFDPLTEVDLASLRFGSPAAVNFGRGCPAIRSDVDGKNLVVTFAGKGHELTARDFAAKMLGRTKRGGLLFGYARVPGWPFQRPMLVALLPHLERHSDEPTQLQVPVENVGLAASTATTPVKLSLRESKQGKAGDGRLLATATVVIPPLAPYRSHIATLPVPKDVEPHGSVCDIEVTVDPDAAGADAFVFKKAPLP